MNGLFRRLAPFAKAEILPRSLVRSTIRLSYSPTGIAEITTPCTVIRSLIFQIPFFRLIFLNFFLVITEVFDHKVAVAPVFFDFYPEFQVDFCIQHTLQLITCIAADLFQHGTLFANDNTFMRITFTDDGRVNINQTVFARTFFHSVNGNGDSVRNLSIKCMQCFFTDNFRGDLSLRLVCHSVLIIKHRTVRQIFQNTSDNILRILSAQCRTRNDLIKIIQLTISIDGLQNFIFINRIDFINHKNDRQMQALQLFCNIRIADDGTGDQLRKECHICSQVYRISLGFHILPVYIHRIAEYLEGIKADSDGKLSREIEHPVTAFTLRIKKSAYLK